MDRIERNKDMKQLKIPARAEAVVRVLSEEVKKPSTKTLKDEEGYARWMRKDKDGHVMPFCPMGLHRNSTSSYPYESEQFDSGKCTTKQVESFADWWDSLSLEEARKAVDLIWQG